MSELTSNPFATKGVEYLIVLLFLAALPLFWRYLNGTPRPVLERALAAGSVLSGWFRLPDALSFHPGHTWAVPAGGRRFRVGLDDFAQKVLGPASALTLPGVGARLQRGGAGWTLDVGGRPFALPSPVTGRVVARNETALRDPGLVNGDPYGTGWLLEVEAPRWDHGIRALLRGGRAKEWLARAEAALRRQMSPELGAVLQDGGVPVSGIARALSPEKWDELARDLLAVR